MEFQFENATFQFQTISTILKHLVNLVCSRDSYLITHSEIKQCKLFLPAPHKFVLLREFGAMARKLIKMFQFLKLEFGVGAKNKYKKNPWLSTKEKSRIWKAVWWDGIQMLLISIENKTKVPRLQTSLLQKQPIFYQILT